MSASVLDTLQTQGFRTWLRYPEPDDYAQPTRGVPSLIIDGDEPLPEDLREDVRTERDALKAAVLLDNPPAWLAKLFTLYWSGHETPVKLTSPASGKAETYMVSVSIKNICAAVAAEIGAPVREWERLRAEVEEALGSWKGAA